MFDTTEIEAHELFAYDYAKAELLWAAGAEVPEAPPLVSQRTWNWSRQVWGSTDIRWRCARVNDMVLAEGYNDEPNVH